MTNEHEQPEHTNEESSEEREQPVVRDRRRIDPETGEARESAESADSGLTGNGAEDATEGAAEQHPEGAGEETSNGADETDEQVGDAETGFDESLSETDRALLEAEARVNASTEELQRLQAEYVNYRRRIERERASDREATIAKTIQTLLPALDDLDLARKHGDLEEGPLALVAQKLVAGMESLGLSRVGEVGDRFDPSEHEAIAQLPNPEVQEMTIADVVLGGYRLGDRLVRAAKVAVFVPAD
ncbi:nucleotide exchange factor GrpE [Humidisolicoccus flavus]|uniref:nucleotide exchange factor GrpE n=1 Tax=Humidisolicoccus flavus TaxID=3111414 RepID=UPI0032518264